VPCENRRAFNSLGLVLPVLLSYLTEDAVS
jgi:hypothetical protein